MSSRPACQARGCKKPADMAVRTTAPRDKCLTTTFWQDVADAPKTATPYCAEHGSTLVRDVAQLSNVDDRPRDQAQTS